MGALEQFENLQFLGEEFATWLYWKSETGNGHPAIKGLDEFELWFEAPVELVNDYNEATSVILKGSTPLESPEAREAFSEGKKLARARLRFNIRNQTYTCGFNAATMAITGVKLPVPPDTPEADRIHLRLEILEEFEAFFQKLYEVFIRLRTHREHWAAERKQIRAWISKVAGD
ncbi:MAG: hypothetical protein K1X53_11835 [Candidatus Sumerlaeaceae bacterium]|nr:hypothetical protein [Candidatus Sumerlaeaceae bacterium]